MVFKNQNMYINDIAQYYTWKCQIQTGTEITMYKIDNNGFVDNI